jgi:hypothetical protein
MGTLGRYYESGMNYAGDAATSLLTSVFADMLMQSTPGGSGLSAISKFKGFRSRQEEEDNKLELPVEY